MESTDPKHLTTLKWSMLIAVLIGMVCPPAFGEDGKAVKVFLLGGQSNMVGGGKAAKLEPPYTEPLETLTVWNLGKWKPLSLSLNINKPGEFGPEIPFGHAIAQAYPGEDIRLVKYARGGTALFNDWSPETKGPQYVEFMKTAKAALADLDASKVEYEIVGMMWLQGESDAHERKGEDYEKNLTRFIAHMREEFKTPDMPFIIARVRDFYGGKTGQAKMVRDAQVKIAESDPNAAWFDTDDLTMRNAGHYDAAGLLEIGKRFAASYQKLKKDNTQ